MYNVKLLIIGLQKYVTDGSIDGGSNYAKGGELMAEAKRLVDWRKERHMTQMELAVAAKLTLATIQSIESARRGVTLNTAQRIAAALGVSLTDIAWPTEEEIQAKHPKAEEAVA